METSSAPMFGLVRRSVADCPRQTRVPQEMVHGLAALVKLSQQDSASFPGDGVRMRTERHLQVQWKRVTPPQEQHIGLHVHERLVHEPDTFGTRDDCIVLKYHDPIVRRRYDALPYLPMRQGETPFIDF